MQPFQMIAGGTFNVSVTGAVAAKVLVECQSQNPPDLVIARALTGWGRLNNASALQWFWQRSLNQGEAKGIVQSSHASAPVMTPVFVTAGGISVYDTANPPEFAVVVGTVITGNAGTFIVTVTSSATFAVGDYVRLYSTTGELQIAGYTFQITAVPDATHITLGYMASAVAGGLPVFAANATSVQVLKYIPSRYYPHWSYIAFITQASQAVVFFTAKNDYTPGEIVSFRVSSDFGMDEINNKTARVLSVTNSATVSSITLDLDTSGYTAFKFPTSAVALANKVSPAVCVPSSSGVVPFNGSATIPQQPPGTNLLDSFDNRNLRVIEFGAGLFNVATFVSTDNDKWEWEAYKYDKYTALSNL